MYYSEILICNELHYKKTRKGAWIKFTRKMLNDRIVELEKRLLEEFNINNGDSNNE
jgi:hypothetical protein